MNSRLRVGFVFLTALVLAGCVVVVHQPTPDPFTMRVTKDGTEILLRQNYAKVKAALEVMLPPNLKRLGYPDDALTRWPALGVTESVAGKECRLRLEERPPNPADGHSTRFEVLRAAEGLTRVRVKSEQWGVGLSSAFTGKLPSTRTTEVEHTRLTELIQTAAP